GAARGSARPGGARRAARAPRRRAGRARGVPEPRHPGEAPARHRLAEQDIPVLRRRRARVEGADDGREDLVRGDAHGGRAAAEESGWSDINAANLARLHAGIGDAPLIELPFLFVEEFGCAELEQTARLLEAGIAGRAEPAARRRSRSS